MNRLAEDFLRPLTLPQIAQLHTFASEMIAWGITAEEVERICVERLEATRSEKILPSTKKPEKRSKRKTRLSEHSCPECGSALEITPVNISRCTNIGGPWKSSLICSRHECRWTELSEKSVMEWNDVDNNA